uniref:NADH dehydrogenase subunit 1 n=1 Tax=Allanaspides helonomus TaxID=91997 RepID=UPI002A83B011|nr:NADH dehydrogenase subunit 1 [Allanaspides helonomus]WOR80952.1 NADH dehydrogenase subunit 1 [Allanaspides helonomus]WOR80965.1 NADH dehydrogenase subunit 1 [Allanaspides helonomus]
MLSLVMVLNYVILMICVLVGVAFLTLLERKILGYIQIRKGPNKVGVSGLFQPFADAVKLFSKELSSPVTSNFLPYYISPVMTLFLSLVIWAIVPYEFSLVSFEMSVLFFLACSSLGVYTIMSAGWSSNSKYALLGSLRSAAQTISYEVSLALILLSFIFMVGSFDFLNFSEYQKEMWFIFIGGPLSMVWFVSCLAETNRTPFDFAEGESELVSGFNVEYSSGGFALIFMGEYSMILFMSMLFSLMFLGGAVNNMLFYMKLGLVSFMFVWVRGTLPRFRYDKLMSLAWKSFLPVSLNYLLFFSSLKVFLMVSL